MARIRTIRPEFFLHETLAELPPITRLAFIGLWTLADREGRLEDRPKRIRASLFPYEDVDADAIIGDLASAGFVVRYAVNGERFISIPAFTKHQHVHVKEPSSTIPAPCEHGASTGQAPGLTGYDNNAPQGSESVEARESTGPAPGEHGAGPLDSLMLDAGKLDAGKTEKGKPGGLRLPERPDWIPEFAWSAWIQHRTEIRKPLKPTQCAAQFAKLDQLRQDGHRPEDVIAHSIAGGWQGLFPPDRRRMNGKPSALEESARALGLTAADFEEAFRRD